MASLVGCIKKAGELIHAEDKAAVLARAKELRAAGVDVSEAARQAIRERLGHLEGLDPEAKGVDRIRPQTMADVAAQRPDMLVKLPGSEEALPVGQAVERAKAQAAEVAEEAGWMQAALDCALSG